MLALQDLNALSVMTAKSLSALTPKLVSAISEMRSVMEINEIDRVTAQVVDAARESLVIGVCA